MKTVLERYARVLLDVGIGLSSDQRLLIQAPIHAVDLARELSRQAYRRGARNVDVLWIDREVDRAKLRDGTLGAATEVSLEALMLTAATERTDAFIRLIGDDEIPADTPAEAERARLQAEAFNRASAAFRRAMFGGMAWTMAGVPGPAWARRVFPSHDDATAVELLWQAVARTCRLDEADPVTAWKRHLTDLDRICQHLDDQQFRAVRLRGPGTDLDVGLSPEHAWAHPGSAPWGCANIPTEEAPTAPHADLVEGHVTVQKPVVINDTVVSGIRLVFRSGVVVESSATEGQDALDHLLAQPGGNRLGEVSLVPQSSRVAREQLVWHNILFDENDASHIALGSVIPPCIHGGAAMSPDELRAVGANICDEHVDLVVGSDQLSVHGVSPDGTEALLMEQGEWAITP